MNSTDTSHTKKENAREALLRAAERLFVEKGYDAVSTRELAEAAGVNLGAIQYHFGSKAKLFVETVHSMMVGSGCVKARLDLGGARNREEAAERLGEFIQGFMEYLLRPVGPQVCRLMIREVLSETSEDKEMFEALVSSVVEEFSKPMQETLIGVLAMIQPQATARELERCAFSIMGQCSYYATNRPFIERMIGEDLSQSPQFEQSIAHVFRFTLRALGCEESYIEKHMRLFEPQNGTTDHGRKKE